MADNVTLNAGSGGDVVATEDIAGVEYQKIKLVDGTATSTTTIPLSGDLTNGLDVDVTRVQGTVTVDLGANNDVTLATLPDTASGDLAAINTAVSGTLTVGSHAVTNAGTFAVQQTNVHSADFDTGAGTDTTIAMGIAVPANGGAAVVPGDATAGLKVNLGADNDVTLATLPDTASGDLAAINTAVSGTLTVGSHAVTNAGTFAVQVDGSALTALQLIDDYVFADDAAFTLASSKVAVAGAIRDDSLSTLTAIEGDAVPLRVSSTGALHVTGGGGGTEYSEDVATPATITGTATVMERDDALSALTPIEGDWAAMRCSAEGALWTQDFNSDAMAADLSTIAGAVSTEMQVDVVGALPAGDNNIGNVDIVSLPASTNTLEVVGDVAHDAAAAGNPVLTAARATNSIEGLTQVAAADSTYVTSDLNGCLVTRQQTTLEEVLSERVSDTAGTSTAFTTFAAGGAGVHNYVTSIVVHNAHASTSGYVDIRDGTAGSVLATIPAPATGGTAISFPVPLKGSANTALAYDVSAAISTVYITIIGFQAQG